MANSHNVVLLTTVFGACRVTGAKQCVLVVLQFDLKSPNILCARDSTAKIADVGLAKFVTSDHFTQVTTMALWHGRLLNSSGAINQKDRITIFAAG